MLLVYIFCNKVNCYICCMIFDMIDLTLQNYFVEVAYISNSIPVKV